MSSTARSSYARGDALRARGAGTPFRRARNAQGHASPPDFWYDQEEHEFVVLLSGAAEVEFEPPRPRVRLETGDWLVIPRHVRHRVAWTLPGQETIWLAVFYD